MIRPGTFVLSAAAALLLACGGGGGAARKSSYPIKDDTKTPDKAVKVPVAKSLQDLVGGQIVAINVVGDPKNAKVIREAIGSKPGDAFNVGRVGNDIRAIWATQRVADVKVTGVLVGPEKVSLTYTIKARPIIRSVLFQGNKQIPDKELGQLIKFKKGALLDMVAVFNLRDDIGEYYTEKGFLLASVQTKTRTLSHNRVDVMFKIDERVRISIASIKFEGVGGARAKALAALVRQPGGTNSVGGPYVAAKFRRSLLRVTDYYYNRGYINVVVREPKVSFLAKNKKQLTVTVKITEGKRYRVGKVAIKGSLKAPVRVYRARLKLRRGQIFSRAKVVAAIKRLVALHKSKGIDQPNITPVTKINQRRHTVDLTFQVQ